MISKDASNGAGGTSDTDDSRAILASHEAWAGFQIRNLEQLAADLGVHVAALHELGVYFDARRSSYWPMRGPLGEVCGLRVRLPNGRKLTVAGQSNGFFASSIEDQGGYLLVVEGGSDAAAGLSLGFDTIGRASAHAGQFADAGAASRCKGRDVVVIPDADTVGIDGACAFAERVMISTRSLRWLLPPRDAKDLRASLCAGLTRGELRESIEVTPPLRGRVEVRS